jgi:hypothetical protein
MSSKPVAHTLRPIRSLTLVEIAALQQVQPVASVEELAVYLWESDEELDEFLRELRSTGDSNIG